MTTAEVFAINQEINERLSEMADGDAPTRRARHKDIMELVTKLCVELTAHNEKSQKGLSVI